MSCLNTQPQSILLYAENTCPPLRYDIHYVKKQLNKHKYLYIVPYSLTPEQRFINEKVWAEELHGSLYCYLIHVKPTTSLSRVYTSVIQKISHDKDPCRFDKWCFVIPFHCPFHWKENLRKSIQQYTKKRVSFIERNYRSKQVHDKWSRLVKKYYQYQNPKYKNLLLHYIPESIGIEFIGSMLAMLFAIM